MELQVPGSSLAFRRQSDPEDKAKPDVEWVEQSLYGKCGNVKQVPLEWLLTKYRLTRELFLRQDLVTQAEFKFRMY